MLEEPQLGCTAGGVRVDACIIISLHLTPLYCRIFSRLYCRIFYRIHMSVLVLLPGVGCQRIGCQQDNRKRNAPSHTRIDSSSSRREPLGDGGGSH